MRGCATTWDEVAAVVDLVSREYRGRLDLSAASRVKAHDTASATARADEARNERGEWARGKTAKLPGAHGGATILTLGDGSKVVRKTGTKDAMDREQLAASVARAVGAPAPKVTRVAPGEIHQEYIAGRTGKQWAESQGQDAVDELRQTDQGRRIGLLDYVTRNNDRHNENWMVDRQGRPVAIDNGAAFSGEEWQGGDFAPVDGPDVTEDEARAARASLAALKPEFEAAGQAGWYAAVMNQINKQVQYTISEQAAGGTGDQP